MSCSVNPTTSLKIVLHRLYPAICNSRSKISNYSARKTAIIKLLDENIDPLHVAQLGGHKSTESLTSYHIVSSSQQRNMSDIFNRRNQLRPPLQPISAIASSSDSLPSETIFHGANIQNRQFTINNCYGQQEHKQKTQNKLNRLLWKGKCTFIHETYIFSQNRSLTSLKLHFSL